MIFGVTLNNARSKDFLLHTTNMILFWKVFLFWKLNLSNNMYEKKVNNLNVKLVSQIITIYSNVC